MPVCWCRLTGKEITLHFAVRCFLINRFAKHRGVCFTHRPKPLCSDRILQQHSSRFFRPSDIDIVATSRRKVTQHQFEASTIIAHRPWMALRVYDKWSDNDSADLWNILIESSWEVGIIACDFPCNLNYAYDSSASATVGYRLEFDDTRRNSTTSDIRERIRNNSIQEMVPRIFFSSASHRVLRSIGLRKNEEKRGASPQVEIWRMNVGTQAALVGIPNHGSYFRGGDLFLPANFCQFMLTKYTSVL